jgi:hypothetical protein
MAKKKKMLDHDCEKDLMCCAKAMLLKGIIILGVCWPATKLLWDWIVPDLFPTGILAATVSWYTAFKIALVSTALILIKKKSKYKMMMHMKKMK